MFERIIKRIKISNHIKAEQKVNSSNMSYLDKQYSLDKSIEENISAIKKVLGKSDDIIFREFYFGVKHQTKAFISFVDGLGDKNLILEYIVKSLMVDIHIINPDGKLVDKYDMFNDVKKRILSLAETSEIKTLDEVIDAILSGSSCLLIDGSDIGLSISAKGGEKRSVTQPENEVGIRGSREAFVETLRVNTSLLRRIIKNPNLVFEPFTIGKQTHTDISIAYIDGIVNKKVLDEVRTRLGKIKIDSVLESGYIEQMIEDHPLSFFATVGNSERPDKVAAKLLEGRVAILCNGTPTVLTVPYLFIESLQVPEDYYSRPFFASLIRIFRITGFLVTLTLPALYISLTTFHQEMIPTVLLITFASSREGIPFPAFVETLISETIYQLLRESGIRMPRAVGSAVSIVGTLVIGDAAVKAGIISAPMVIITALSAITGFILPAVYDSVLIFKFIFIFLSGAFGLFGLTGGLICMLAYMCSLRSFGTPFMAPFAPTIWSDLKDNIFRFPLWLMKKRPLAITVNKSQRQADSLKQDVLNRKKGGKRR